jgi:succinate dehydrogenase/fumarate reductase flavoprotein subunit
MKIERTWYAADKTGFHMLHTLFQTSLKFPSIRPPLSGGNSVSHIQGADSLGDRRQGNG